MKTYYAVISAKSADEASTELASLGKNLPQTQELEVRQVIPYGQKALVLYLLYDKGTLK